MTHHISSLTWISDEELLTRVIDLTRREREVTATVIAHLAEVDARRLYLPEGCSSMFTYCTEVLRFSESAAYARIQAARAARTFPMILDRLVAGSVNLTTIVLLAPHLTRDNHNAVLDEAAGRTRRQVEELVARLRPQPPVPASIRKLPAPKQAGVTPPAVFNLERAPAEAVATAAPRGIPPSTACEPPPSDVTTASAPEPEPLIAAPRPPGHRAAILPLSPEHYRLQVTLRAETYVLLRQAQELMRHTIPNGDPAAILDRALADLVEKLSRRKFAALSRPRSNGTE